MYKLFEGKKYVEKWLNKYKNKIIKNVVVVKMLIYYFKNIMNILLIKFT